MSDDEDKHLSCFMVDDSTNDEDYCLLCGNHFGSHRRMRVSMGPNAHAKYICRQCIIDLTNALLSD